MTPKEMEEFIEENKDLVLEPLDDDPSKPRKSMDELMTEGKITARQYRSILFLMQSGYSASSSPDGIVTDIDRKIEELTKLIEKEESM